MLSRLTETDSRIDGLERILRFLQAIIGLTLAYLVPNPKLSTLIFRGMPNTPLKRAPLSQLRSQLGVMRRTIRFFRFIDAFAAALSIYSSPLTLLSWLDSFASTFNGLYLLLESSLVLDAMDIPGLRIWGDEHVKAVNFEAQRSWFFALAAGAAACVLRINRLRAERQSAMRVEADSKNKDEKQTNPKDRQAVSVAALDSQLRAQQRKVVTNCVDLILPGSTIGWIPASAGLVSLATLVTTLLSGYDVWYKVVKS
jgi:hypothetical protein